MNVNEIALAAAAVALLASIVLIAITARRRARQMMRLMAAADDLRDTLQSVQSDLARMQEEKTPAPLPPPSSPSPLLTIDQRAGAIEMYRSGADPADVAAAMGISHPEAVLLQKVQRFQAGAHPELTVQS